MSHTDHSHIIGKGGGNIKRGKPSPYLIFHWFQYFPLKHSSDVHHKKRVANAIRVTCNLHESNDSLGIEIAKFSFTITFCQAALDMIS